MISQSALPAGVDPQPPQNPKRKFKKRDGSYANTFSNVKQAKDEVRKHRSIKIAIGPRFYNLEGEAGMREYRQEEVLIVPPPQSDDYSAYQSWLFSFTSLCQDPNARRVDKRQVEDPKSHRWHAVKKTVGKVLVCNLATDEVWGTHIDTMLHYRNRMQRSEMQRKGNTNGDDVPLHLVKTDPPQFTTSMSTQVPIEGHEHRCRPPSTKQLVSRAWKDFYSSGKRVDVRKFIKSVLPNDTRILPNELLMQYGTSVSEKELLSHQRKMRYEARKAEKVEKAANLSRGTERVGSMVISSLEEFEGHDFSSPEIEKARYFSWKNAPEVMSKSLYTLSMNFVVPSPEALKAFNEKFPQSLDRWYDHYHYEESDRLQTWLLIRDCHNNNPKILKPLHIPSSVSPLKRRMMLTAYNWRSGKIDVKHFVAYKRIMDNYSRLIKLARWSAQAPVLVSAGDVSDWTKDEKKQLMRDSYRDDRFGRIVADRIGLDHQIPMTDMEYRNIVRVKPTSVDDYVEQIIIEDFSYEDIESGFGAYGPVAEQLAINSEERVREQMSRPIIGSIELGNAYALDEELGFFMPNFNSQDLEKVLDQVSQ